MATVLTFSRANRKLQQLAKWLGVPAAHVTSFSLPAGVTCPGANECRARSTAQGTVLDYPGQRFRCFAATLETAFPSLRAMNYRNLAALKEIGLHNPYGMVQAFEAAMYSRTRVVRTHICGDYFNRDYMLAWVLFAKRHPNVHYYGYTKSLPWVLELKDLFPPNFKLVYSMGGKYDALAKEVDWPSSYVVFNEEEAAERGLPIDYGERIAIQGDRSFALLLHSTQPKGTEAAEAWAKLNPRWNK